MGAWGCGILDNDTVLDIAHRIGEHIGRDNHVNRNLNRMEPGESSARLLNEHLDSILDLYAWWRETLDDERLFYQYLTYEIIRLGAVLPDEVKRKTLEMNSLEIAECENGSSVWREPDVRKAVLEKFNSLIESYVDGEMVRPVDIAAILNGPEEKPNIVEVKIPILVSQNGRMVSSSFCRESDGTCKEYPVDVDIAVEPCRFIYVTAHVNVDELFRDVEIEGEVSTD